MLVRGRGYQDPPSDPKPVSNRSVGGLYLSRTDLNFGLLLSGLYLGKLPSGLYLEKVHCT